MKRTPHTTLLYGTLLVSSLLAGYASAETPATERGTEATLSRTEHAVLATRYAQEATLAQEKMTQAQQAIEWYEQPGHGNYATVKGGLFGQLYVLVRHYKQLADEDLALAQRHREEAALAQQ